MWAIVPFIAGTLSNKCCSCNQTQHNGHSIGMREVDSDLFSENSVHGHLDRRRCPVHEETIIQSQCGSQFNLLAETIKPPHSVSPSLCLFRHSLFSLIMTLFHAVFKLV